MNTSASPVVGRRRVLMGLTASAAAAILAACGGATPTAAPTVKSSPPAAGIAPITPTVAAVAATSAPSGALVPASPPAASAATAPSATPVAAAKSGGQVSIYWTKPSTIHPLFSTAGIEQGIERQLFGALVRTTDKLDVIPDLAEKIDVSPDAKVYTFHLKPGLKFSDGQPLTAKDVAFTLERAVDKRTGSYWRSRLLQLDGASEFGDGKAPTIRGVETPDDTTVKMTLTTPDSTWLLTLGDFAGLGILPMHTLKDVPPDQMAKSPFAFAPTPSAGAFVFGDWKADQYLELRRNETYAGGPKAKLDRIFCKVLTQQDVGIAQLEKGEIDAMIVPVTEIDRLKKNATLSVVSVPSASISDFTVNLDKPMLKDKRVRQAILYALDREGMVKEILKGEAQIVNTYGLGPDWMGTPDGLNEYKYDPDKARQLLKDANWPMGQKIAFTYVPGDKVNDALVPIFQQQLMDVGIVLTLQGVDTPESNRRLVTSAAPDHAGDYEIAISGGGVWKSDPNVLAKYFTMASFSPAGGNNAHYFNPKVEELLQAGRQTADKQERKKIYTQMTLIINDELPKIPLWSPNSIFAFNKRLQGFKPAAYASHFTWNAEEWSVTQ